MRRIVWALVLLGLMCSSAQAEIVSVKVCENKPLAGNAANPYGLGNGITDCAYTDLSGFRYYSFQAKCTDSNDSAIIVSFDWVGGSLMGAAYMGVPLLNATSSMAQLRTSFGTEDVWTTLQTIQPPVSPVGTIRITNGEPDADVTCTVILNMGN